MSAFFYSYQQMKRDAEALERSFPGQIRTCSLAKTEDDREILELRLGQEKSKSHILIQAGLHGREYMNSAVLLHLTKLFLQERKDPGNMCFHILPMVNPDGCTISQEGGAGICSRDLQNFIEECWRKECAARRRYEDAAPAKEAYCSRWKANARGVDINRNFCAGWESCGESSLPGAWGYRGVSPESEAETKAVLKVCRNWELACAISYHSSGSLIYWDYGGRGAFRDHNRKLAETIGFMTGYPLHSAVADGVVGGGCSDYLARVCKIPAVTVETGTGECPLDTEEFPLICEENRILFYHLAGFTT